MQFVIAWLIITLQNIYSLLLVVSWDILVDTPMREQFFFLLLNFLSQIKNCLLRNKIFFIWNLFQLCNRHQKHALCCRIARRLLLMKFFPWHWPAWNLHLMHKSNLFAQTMTNKNKFRNCKWNVCLNFACFNSGNKEICVLYKSVNLWPLRPRFVHLLRMIKIFMAIGSMQPFNFSRVHLNSVQIWNSYFSTELYFRHKIISMSWSQKIYFKEILCCIF